VVDHRTLVVGAEEDERPVDREEVLRAEALDLALIVEDAAQFVFLWRHLRHGRLA
jgi:hypothetical protein